MDTASCNLQNRERYSEGYIEKLRFGNDINFRASNGSASWITTTDTVRKKMTRSAKRDIKTVLLAARSIPVVREVQLHLFWVPGNMVMTQEYERKRKEEQKGKQFEMRKWGIRAIENARDDGG